MSGIKKNAEPAPIDLTVFEDYFLDILEVDRGKGFGAFVQVHSKENGKTVEKNLWDTANPQGIYGQDGFLSYEEAKGKTFEIPIAFCNSPGTMAFEVTNRSAFRELPNFLATPLRVHNSSFHSCQQKAQAPEVVPPLPDPETMRDLLNNLGGIHDQVTTKIADGLYETFGPYEEISAEKVLESFRASASTFASGLAKNAVTYSFQLGIEAAFQGGGLPFSSNQCNWELDEELPDHCFEEN